MAEKIQLQVEVKGGESVAQASDKVKSLKTQLKELKAQLASGNLSADEFQRIAQQAGELDDKIRDVNQQVKNLGSDTSKLDGFINITQGIAGGFAAAQGAMALFGSENEDLQKSLVKVQGAVALLSGVQAIANTLQKESAAMTAFATIKTNLQAGAQRFLTATTLQTVGATYALRAALIATGIGAIVVLLGAAAGAMGMFGDSTDNTAEATDRLKQSQDELKQSLEASANEMARIDAINMEKSKQRGDTLSKQIKIEQDALQNRLDEGRAEIQRIIALRSEAKIGSKEYLEFENQRNAQAQKNLDIANQIELSKVRYDGALKNEEADNLKKLEDKKNSSLEAAQKRSAEFLRIKAEEIRLLIEQEEILGTLTIDRQRYYLQRKLELGLISRKEFANAMLKTAKDEQTAEKEANQKAFDETFAQLEAEMEAEQESYDKRIENAKEYAKQTKEVDQSIQDSKVGFAQQTGELLGQIAGKNKELAILSLAIEKGAAIAGIIINTQREISGYYVAAAARSALTAGATTAFDQALAAKQSVFAKVRAGLGIANIVAAGVNGAKSIAGGGNNGGGSGGGNPTGNQPNIQGYTTNNQPNQQGGQSGNMRVYVTETDIRNATRRINGIYSQATVE